MTKVALKGPVNGTGTYTLRAPETASTLELELPLAGTHLAGAQADGTPLGLGGDPVVESGSNSDGDWTKFADGTALAWVEKTVPSQSYSPGQTVSVAGNIDWAYPVTFIAGKIPTVTYSRRSSWVYEFVDGYESIDSIVVNSWYVVNKSTATRTTSHAFAICAYSRWK